MRPRLGSIVGPHADVVGGVAFDGVGTHPSLVGVWAIVTPASYMGVWGMRPRLGSIVGSHAGAVGDGGGDCG